MGFLLLHHQSLVSRAQRRRFLYRLFLHFNLCIFVVVGNAIHSAIGSLQFLMGAPKQKWTAEEESALKAGVSKHGSGNWRTILRDPEFSGILVLRSNVDLKDKWRNMRSTVNGWGSREKSRVALKKSRTILKHDDNPLALSIEVENVDDELIDYKLLEGSSETVQITGWKRSISKMEDLILEAITCLKEPKGSNKSAIAIYIEDQYITPADFKLLLSVKLKEMTGRAKLVKVRRKYRIAPNPAMMEGRKLKVSHLEVRQKETLKEDRNDKSIAKFQVDAELAWMRNMTVQEAAAAAAQAIAEAEKAMAEAEEATREAEAAEADAEAAQAFAEAAMFTLKSRNTTKLCT